MIRLLKLKSLIYCKMPIVKPIPQVEMRDIDHILAANLLVQDVVTKTRSTSLHLGDPGGDLLDGLNLLIKECLLNKVAEMSISIRCFVHVKQTLVHSLLKFESCLKSIQRCSPLHGAGFGNILEHHLSSSLVLILDQLLSVFSLLVRCLLEESRESWQSLVIPVKVGGHGHVDIAGVELHVDLLVDQSLALLPEVLANS